MMSYAGWILDIKASNIEDYGLNGNRRSQKSLNKKLRKYEVTFADLNQNTDFQFEENYFIGRYDDFYDLLENCIIDGVKSKDVIMHNDTIIEGKDQLLSAI